MRTEQSMRRAHTKEIARTRECESKGASFRRLAYVLAGVLVLVQPAGVLARYARSPIQSPIPSATQPPSSYQSGVTRLPDPTSNPGNLVVTGNVGGAKQLRAPVPYQSPTRFEGRLGSTSLDPFLRRSATGQTGVSVANENAFYSPTGTVSKLGTQQPDASAQSSLRVPGDAPQARADVAPTNTDSAELARPQAAGPAPSGVVKDWSMWEKVGSAPVSRPSASMWNVLSPARPPQDARGPRPQPPTTIREYDDRQVQDVLTAVPARQAQPTMPPYLPKRTGDDALGVSGTGQLFERLGDYGEASTETRLGVRPPSLGLPEDGQSGFGQPQGIAPANPLRTSLPGTLPDSDGRVRAGDSRGKTLTVGDLQAALSGRTKPPDATVEDRLDNVFLPPAAETATGGRAQSTDTLPALQRVEETARRFDTPADLLSRPSSELETDIDRAQRSTPRYMPQVSGRRRRSADRVATTPRAGETAGSNVTAQIRNRQSATPKRPSPLNAFEQHMQAGRSYMQQGRYYRAAESFTRASVYRPGDPLPHLGRSLALFAAGEYVSSSLLLARAIELNPQCAVAQANIVDAAGGPAQFEHRLADLEQCLESSDAPQLQFLLAYVYHQIGRMSEAAEAAGAAQRAMPSSIVVDILKAAVAP